MKVPTSWNDKSLLQDEPFVNWFHPATIEVGKRESAIKTEVMKEIQTLKNPDCRDIVKSWINYAFVRTMGTRGKCPETHDYATIRLFVDFYFQLSRNEDKALQVLNRARSARGFGPFHPNATTPTFPLSGRNIKLSISRPTRRHSKQQHLKHSDKAKAKVAVSDSITATPLVERPASQISTSRKTRSSSARLALLHSSKKHIDRSSKKRSKCNQASGDEQIGISVNASLPSTRDVCHPLRHINVPDEKSGRSLVVNKRIKSGKSSLAQGLRFIRHPSKTAEANTDINTLQVKVEPDVGTSGALKESSPQLPQKRPATASTYIDRETKRRRARVAPKIVDNFTTDSKNIGRESTKYNRKHRRQDSNNSLEDKGKVAKTSNIVQGVKVENLTLSAPFPLNNNSLENNHPVPPLFLPPSQQTQTLIQAIECREFVAPPSSEPSRTPVPSALEPPMVSPTLDSAKVTITTFSVSDDTKNTILVSALSAKNDYDFPISTLQFPPDESHPITYKPSLPKFPPIWAQSRQEVCESFDWFRSYQGGVYHSKEIVKGYLLSGFPTRGDRFEHGGRLIISHGGGKSESMHSIKGHVSSQPASNQLAQDKSVRALLNNYKNNRPLTLLIDDKYALFPYDLGARDITYAVLGFYIVENVWAEYQSARNSTGHVVRYKFAFRWCEEQGPPWWMSKVPALESIQPLSTICDLSQNKYISVSGDRLDKREVYSIPSESNTCQCCQKESPRVFEASWVCLNPECPMFWKQAGGPCIGHYLSGDLSYSPKFLDLPPYKPLPFGFPEIVTSLSLPDLTINSRHYHFTRGFHCTKCGRLSCRYQWEKWQCSHCNESLTISDIPRQASDLWNQILPISFKDYLVNPNSDIVSIPPATFIHDNGRGAIRSFVLPHRRGKIHHIQSGNANGRKEADLLFLEYQMQAASGILKFRRWPLRAHKCRGPLLTNYFSHNAGEPYQYVGGDANTVPFESAPAVCKARDLIQKRIKQALDISAQFNEVLSAAYMERQKMAFHSDDEIGLGPLVAGLSLGSPALMHFRLHGKYDPEGAKKGILLSIVLRHGDVLVMDGAGIQECYEHTVVPNNFRIAATARQIGFTHHI